MKENSMIYSKSLSVGYGKKIVVEGIDISLEKGKILTLIGPNGAGKSTILKSIANQLEILGGDVFIMDENIKKLNAKDMSRLVSVMFTESVKMPLSTCFDVVSLSRYPYTGRMGILNDWDRQKITEAFELVNASDIMYEAFDEISDGQRQRVMLAKALCQDTDILILDEPTSYLDIKYKLELIQILKNMVEQKSITVFMSLHELELAQKISDYIICIKNKRVDRHGTVDNVFKDEYIRELYDLSKGSYDSSFGFVELEPVRKKPEIFVIGGNGSAISVYRRLNKEGIAFATGVLHKNDIDYMLAKRLAMDVIAENAFEIISEKNIKLAEAVLLECDKIVCTVREFGVINEPNKQLLDIAKRNNKKIEFTDC